MSDALVSLLTALADDELVLGHRHSEWTGFAPHLEEDVAFSSIAQDEIGHAGNYYALIAKLTGTEPDDLALGRTKDGYRHAVLCERPNGDWAYTLARHWLYDVADDVRLQALEETEHADMRALVHKIHREERYHLIHADHWMKRMAHGPVEGRNKVVDALAGAYPEAMAIFESLEDEEVAVKEGWLPAPSEHLRDRFAERVATALDELDLPTDIHTRITETAEFVASSSGDLIAGDEAGHTEGSTAGGMGGRRGRHTEDFDELWATMTYTYRTDPGATW